MAEWNNGNGGSSKLKDQKKAHPPGRSLTRPATTLESWRIQSEQILI
jgi:hypothetical protein